MDNFKNMSITDKLCAIFVGSLIPLVWGGCFFVLMSGIILDIYKAFNT